MAVCKNQGPLKHAIKSTTTCAQESRDVCCLGFCSFLAVPVASFGDELGSVSEIVPTVRGKIWG